MWIDHSNYPGGPLEFYSAPEGAWYNAFGFLADITAAMLIESTTPFTVLGIGLVISAA